MPCLHLPPCDRLRRDSEHRRRLALRQAEKVPDPQAPETLLRSVVRALAFGDLVPTGTEDRRRLACLRSSACSSAFSNILAAVAPDSRSRPRAEPRARPRRCVARRRAGRAAGPSERPRTPWTELPRRIGRKERIRGSRPERMPVYAQGLRKKPRARLWSPRATAPRNSHCTPYTLTGRGRPLGDAREAGALVTVKKTGVQHRANLDHSYLRASIGFSAAAFRAG